MKLVTKVQFQKLPFKINHQDQLFFIGSCFSENIGNKFKRLHFNTKINPLGICYNPILIAQILERILSKKLIDQNEVVEHEDRFFTFLNHSKLNSRSSEKHLKKINKLLVKTEAFLSNTDYIFFTFGTAYYYKHLASNCDVANCHKLPNNQFEKKLATNQMIVSSFQKCIDQLKTINPKIKILFSLSPVRHIRDGIEENSLSKSILRLSINQLVNKIPGNCFYLPVYELQIDELRDYRFYNEDLIHPNGVAIKIIWERLEEIFFDEKTKNINSKIEKYKLMKNHKIMHKKSEAAQKLIAKIKNEKQELKSIGIRKL